MSEEVVQPKKKRKALLHYHIKRISGVLEVPSDNVVIPFTLVLNDFHPEWAVIFAMKKLPVNAEAILKISDPVPFQVSTYVVSSQELLEMNKIIGRDVYRFRVGLRFKFEDEEQRKSIFNTCNDLIQKYMTQLKAVA